MSADARFNLEAAIAAWRRFWMTERSISVEDADELESHLHDEMDTLVGRGLEPAAAFHEAVQRLGDYATLERAYRRVYWKKAHAERRLALELRWRLSMLKNYLTTAFRSLMKRKFFSMLNLGGLALGIASCLLIFQYVAFERSFDAFHANADHLYRITRTPVIDGAARDTDAKTWRQMGPAFAADIPEIQDFARYAGMRVGATVATLGETGEHKVFMEHGLAHTDPAFLRMFSFPLLQGDAATALTEPGTLLLSASMAHKYFGTTAPLGKALRVRNQDYTVRGVFEDVPENSHLQFDFLLPMDDLLQGPEYQGTNGWTWANFSTYVQLSPDADVDTMSRRLSQSVINNVGGVMDSTFYRIGLQPLQAIHLRSAGFGDVALSRGLKGSDYKTLYFLSLVALFILVIAWINHVNLSTARALDRAKEVGVRKAAGARRSQIVSQFLFESALVNGAALALAVGLSMLLRPFVNAWAGVTLTMEVWRDPRFWGVFVAIFGAGALVSSLYPAFVLSSYRPIAVLKGRLGALASGLLLRKALVVFQFAASMALLTGTYVVYLQVHHMRSRDLGFDLDQTLVVKGPQLMEPDVDEAAAINTFKQEVSQHAAIRRVAVSSTVPGGGFSAGLVMSRQNAAPTDRVKIKASFIDDDFLETYGVELRAGRTFSPSLATDQEEALLINEAAARMLGFDTNEAALGGKIVLYFGENPVYTVVGVVEDVNWMSVAAEVDPAVFGFSPRGGFYSIKVAAANVAEALETTRRVYDAVFPGNAFDYFFLDAYFNEQYQADQRFGALFGLFAGLALVVACLGLIGLAAFTAAQRTKEIGIRKVLGASAPGIARLLAVDYVKLVLVALVGATPLLYFAAEKWLSSFAARIEVSVWLFLTPGLVVLLVALLAVSYHTIRVALTNPARSLRYE